MINLDKIILSIEKIIMLFYRTHVDHVTTVKLSGHVRDSINAKELGEAKIFFIDTGFDSVRKKDPEKYHLYIGETDKDGYFDFTFQYLWGTDIIWRRIRRIGKNFKLQFVLEDYLPVEFQFDPRMLSDKENKILVSFPKEILLEPKKIK